MEIAGNISHTGRVGSAALAGGRKKIMRTTSRSQNCVKVHLASKDVLTIAGLQQLLRGCSFISVTGTSAADEAMMQALTAENPDVLVVHASSEENLHSVLRNVRAACENLKIVVLTDEGPAEQLVAERVHLEGILVRGGNYLEDIGVILRIVHHGGRVISGNDEWRHHVGRTSVDDKLVDRFQSLSARESIVLREVARGRTNAEIAKPLHVSVATIKADLARIMSTMQTSNRVHLAVLAVRSGLLPELDQIERREVAEDPHHWTGN